MGSAFDNVLAKFTGRRVWLNQRSVQVSCPVPTHGAGHGDRNPSLTITDGMSGAVLKCHAGCVNEDIVEAIGLTMDDLFNDEAMKTRTGFTKKVATQPNVKSLNSEHKKPVHKKPDPEPEAPKQAPQSGRIALQQKAFQIKNKRGELEAYHVRTDYDDGSKAVTWLDPDKKMGLGGRKASDLPLYGTEYLGIKELQDQPVIICEGEKAADALRDRDFLSLGTVTGAANTPSRAVLEDLRDRPVVLWPDNDAEGRAHMKRIGKVLLGVRGATITTDVRWVEVPDAEAKADAYDYFAWNPGDVDCKPIQDAEDFIPPHDPAEDGASTAISVASEYRALRRLRKERKGVTGIASGIGWLDRMTTGFNRGDLVVIGASTGTGKTLLANQLGLTAAQQGYRALTHSPEQSWMGILDRLAHYIADVPYFLSRSGNLTDKQERLVDDAVYDLAKLPFLVDDYGSQTISRIRESIEINEPDIVFIDHLQYLVPEEHHGHSRYQQVSGMVREISQLAGDANIPVVLLSQFSRDQGKRQKKERRPALGDFEGAGTIEQDADIACLLWRPGKDDPDEDERKVILDVAKQRMGKTGVLDLHLAEYQNWLYEPGAESLLQTTHRKDTRQFAEEVRKSEGEDSLLDDLDI